MHPPAASAWATICILIAHGMSVVSITSPGRGNVRAPVRRYWRSRLSDSGAPLNTNTPSAMRTTFLLRIGRVRMLHCAPTGQVVVPAPADTRSKAKINTIKHHLTPKAERISIGASAYTGAPQRQRLPTAAAVRFGPVASGPHTYRIGQPNVSATLQQSARSVGC